MYGFIKKKKKYNEALLIFLLRGVFFFFFLVILVRRGEKYLYIKESNTDYTKIYCLFKKIIQIEMSLNNFIFFMILKESLFNFFLKVLLFFL